MARSKKFRKLKFDGIEYGWSVKNERSLEENYVLIWDIESKQIIDEFRVHELEQIKPSMVVAYIKKNILKKPQTPEIIDSYGDVDHIDGIDEYPYEKKQSYYDDDSFDY